MSAEDILFDADARMEKAIHVLKTSLAGIRTGRANPGLVDTLRVEVYGAIHAHQAIGHGRRAGTHADRDPAV